MGHFEGYFEGAKTFLTLLIVPSAARDNLGVKKVEAPSKYPEKWPIKKFARKQKIISQIFKMSGTLVILCPIATRGRILSPLTGVKASFKVGLTLGMTQTPH